MVVGYSAYAFQVSVDHFVRVEVVEAPRDAKQLSTRVNMNQRIMTERANSQVLSYRRSCFPSSIVAWYPVT